MNKKQSFIFENLRTKSNAIVGFVVIQSLLLADQLAITEFKQKLTGIEFLYNYIILCHSLILLFAIVFLIVIGKKINKNLGDLKNDIYSTQSSIIKICLVIIFGFIPLIILLLRS